MYKLSFYVPESNLEQVKNALFEKGAGRIGNYDCCAWQVKGEGQFRPLAGSMPAIGELHKIEKIVEYLVEMVVADEYIEEVVKTLKAVHPYEEVAFAFYPINKK